MPLRRSLLRQSLGVLASAALAGRAPAAIAAGRRQIRIGYQRYGTMIILKHSGMLEAALAGSGNTVAWSEFSAGPQMLQAMQAGALDIGITGDTPPVFAQAARPDSLIYLAHEPPAPFGEAIIVPHGSGIRTVAGLKGKGVALNRGSNVHWLLLASLAKAGLSFADIRPIYLTPAAGRSAFDTGRVDAWAIWDPYLSSVQANSNPVVLTTANGVVGNRQFFIARRPFTRQNPDLTGLFLAQIARSDAWGEQHKDKVSADLAADTGLPVPVVRTAIDRLTFGVAPMDHEVIAEQQAIADAFLGQGLIPARITIQDAIWHPPG